MKYNSIAKAFNCIWYNMLPRDDLKVHGTDYAGYMKILAHFIEGI